MPIYFIEKNDKEEEMKKICVVTATRAEYGVLRLLLKEIEKDKELELCLVVTGTHLSERFGMTMTEIEQDGFRISEKIKILDSEDSAYGICKTMGVAMERFGELFVRQRPDMLIVVGDRYELISICSSAMVCGIPIAHISGGELTEGAIDDAIRHSVTKMSYLHFPGCEEYRKRIIQLGESPDRVFNYGDIGVENVKKMNYFSIEELEKDLGISLKAKYSCVTFHPVTLEKHSAKCQTEALIEAMATYSDIKFIVTLSNADLDGEKINNMLIHAASEKNNIFCYESLGIRRYLSLVKNASFVLGNSSSGIIEVPCFGIPTINIGDRQKGRLRAESVIDCEPTYEGITQSIKLALSEEFRCKAKRAKNPYGEGDTSEKIVKTIKQFLYDNKIDLKKSFYDLEGWENK